MLRDFHPFPTHRIHCRGDSVKTRPINLPAAEETPSPSVHSRIFGFSFWSLWHSEPRSFAQVTLEAQTPAQTPRLRRALRLQSRCRMRCSGLASTIPSTGSRHRSRTGPRRSSAGSSRLLAGRQLQQFFHLHSGHSPAASKLRIHHRGMPLLQIHRQQRRPRIHQPGGRARSAVAYQSCGLSALLPRAGSWHALRPKSPHADWS